MKNLPRFRSREYRHSELALWCSPEIFPGDDLRLIAKAAIINCDLLEDLIDELDCAVDAAFVRAGYEVPA
jgi:hypothetical protein